MAKIYDAAIIGAGHNGLVAANYLARAGFDVVVLEQREIVGGACVTEELIPGFKTSSCAFVAGLMRPRVFRELELRRRSHASNLAGRPLHACAARSGPLARRAFSTTSLD